MKDLNFDDLETALIALGQLLQDRNLDYQIVGIGGGGLLLIGLMIRTTKDLDLVALLDKGEFISAKPLPTPLVQAIGGPPPQVTLDSFHYIGTYSQRQRRPYQTFLLFISACP